MRFWNNLCQVCPKSHEWLTKSIWKQAGQWTKQNSKITHTLFMNDGCNP